MRRFIRAIPVISIFIIVSAFGQQEDVALASKVYRIASKAIVVIRTSRDDQSAYKQGSGVVIGKNQVATNCHVLEDSASNVIEINGRSNEGKLIRGDIKKDICILETATGSIKPASTRSSNSLIIGETVFAIGSPKGFDLTLSAGLISQLRGGEPPLIQTTAAISPGSSGGGLFDVKGRLVGITTFKINGGDSLNFAAPADWIADLPALSNIQTKEVARNATKSSTETWTYLTEGGGAKSYINRSSIRLSAGRARMWTLNDHDLPQTKPFGTYRSVTELAEYDCFQGRYISLEAIFYSDLHAAGTPIKHMTATQSETWHTVVPDSVAEGWLMVACKQ